jgi:hypothetical protein
MGIGKTSELSLVNTAQIVDGSVTSAKIGAGAVGSAALGSGSVVAASIAAGAVGSSALAENSVVSSKINSEDATSGQILQANGSGGVSFQTVSAGISASVFSNKGDMLVASAASTPSILNVGSNGTLLAADSAASTGVKYATLAVLSNPDTATFVPPTSYPVSNTTGGSGNVVATDGSTVAAVDNSRIYTLSADGTYWIGGTFISSIDSTFNGYASIAYGNGTWLLSFSQSGGYGDIKVVRSTNLSTWSTVFTYRGGNNQSHTRIFYCNSTATTPTFVIGFTNPNTNPNNYPHFFMLTNGVSSYTTIETMNPYYENLTEVDYSQDQNKLYTFVKNYNSSEINLKSWTPNGSSAATLAGTKKFGAASANEGNPSVIAMDAHSAVYVSYTNRGPGFDLPTPAVVKISYPVTSSSTTNDITSTVNNGVRYSLASKFIKAGSNNSSLIVISQGTNTTTTRASILSPSATVSSQYVWSGSYSENENGGQRISYLERDTYTSGSSEIIFSRPRSIVGTGSRVASNVQRISASIQKGGLAIGFSSNSSAGLTEYQFSSGLGFMPQPAIAGSASQPSASINGATTIGDIDIVAGSSGLLWYRNSLSSAFTSATSGFSGTTINGLASSGSVAVAVGDSGKVASSSDGSSWTIRTSGVTTALRSVAFGANKFVAVGAGGTMIRSSDGSTWTSISGPFSTATINSVAYNAKLQLFVAAGTSGLLASSTDGISWTLRTSGTSAEINNVASGAASFAIAFVQPSVATATMRYSYDAVTWTSVNVTIGSTTTNSWVTYMKSSSPFYLFQWLNSSGGYSWTAHTDARSVVGNGSVVIL